MQVAAEPLMPTAHRTNELILWERHSSVSRPKALQALTTLSPWSTVAAMYTSLGLTPGMKDANTPLVNCKRERQGIYVYSSVWEKHAFSNRGVTP